MSENDKKFDVAEKFYKLISLASISFIFVLSGGPLVAGPDEITNRLMEEKVSLLDWGVLRVQMLLDSTPGASANIYFDWESNRFKIVGGDFNMMDQKLGTAAIVECERWFRAVRQAAYVNPTTGKPYFGEASLFSDLFSHAGWTSTINGKITTDILNQLDSKFLLEYSIWMSADAVGDVERLICSGQLLSESFARQEVTKK